jgi:HAD superfamily hydrolase (TIGR01509 family)
MRHSTTPPNRYIGCNQEGVTLMTHDASYVRLELSNFGWFDIYSGWGKYSYDALFTRWRTIYAELSETQLLPTNGIVDALDRITIPVCVASNRNRDDVIRNLTITGLYPRFVNRIFGAEDVSQGKPHPDLYLHISHTLSITPDRCAVIEDSRYGVQAARAAGMTGFAYNNGLTSCAQLQGKATTIFENMQDLPQLLNPSGHKLVDLK